MDLLDGGVQVGLSVGRFVTIASMSAPSELAATLDVVERLSTDYGDDAPAMSTLICGDGASAESANARAAAVRSSRWIDGDTSRLDAETGSR